MRVNTDTPEAWGMSKAMPHDQAYQPDFMPLFCWSSHFFSGAK